jgi:hypothetical protein
MDHFFPVIIMVLFIIFGDCNRSKDANAALFFVGSS